MGTPNLIYLVRMDGVYVINISRTFLKADDIEGIYDDEMMSNLFCKSCFKKLSSLRKRQS